MGRAFYFRDNGGVGAEGSGLDDTPGKVAANNALNNNRLVEVNFAPFVMDSQASADARTGRAAIHLSLSKDAYVTAMRPFS